MDTLTFEHFQAWLELFSRASLQNDAQAPAALFAPNALYFESPFNLPVVGHDAIRRYWEEGAQSFTAQSTACEVLAVNRNPGIARWQRQSAQVLSGCRVAVDCLLRVEFDAAGLCTQFRMWQHLEYTAAPERGAENRP